MAGHYSETPTVSSFLHWRTSSQLVLAADSTSRTKLNARSVARIGSNMQSSAVTLLKSVTCVLSAGEP